MASPVLQSIPALAASNAIFDNIAKEVAQSKDQTPYVPLHQLDEPAKIDSKWRYEGLPGQLLKFHKSNMLIFLYVCSFKDFRSWFGCIRMVSSNRKEVLRMTNTPSGMGCILGRRVSTILCTSFDSISPQENSEWVSARHFR